MALLEDTYVVQSSLFKKKKRDDEKSCFWKSQSKKKGASRSRQRVRERKIEREIEDMSLKSVAIMRWRILFFFFPH